MSRIDEIVAAERDTRSPAQQARDQAAANVEIQLAADRGDLERFKFSVVGVHPIAREESMRRLEKRIAESEKTLQHYRDNPLVAAGNGHAVPSPHAPVQKSARTQVKLAKANRK